jgi:hypothetical protein
MLCIDLIRIMRSSRYLLLTECFPAAGEGSTNTEVRWSSYAKTFSDLNPKNGNDPRSMQVSKTFLFDRCPLKIGLGLEILLLMPIC